MKFPDLVHAVKPEPHHAHAAGRERARHVLGFRLADARVHAHADVGDVGPRHPAQLSHDAGLRRAHLPLGQRARRQRVREVPLEPGRRHAFARLGRGREDLRRRSGLSSPRSVGSDRGAAPIPSGSSGCRSSPRSRPRSSASTCSIPPRSCPRSWCRCSPSAAWCSTAIPTTSSPRPSRWPSAPRTSCRASTSPTIRCSRAASIRTSTRRSRGSAGPTSTRSRSTRRSRRCTTTSATACIARRSIAAAWPTSRIRSAAAARSRPARAASRRFRSRSKKTRCAASRRSSPITTRRRRCSTTARRPSSRRTSCARSASS